MERTTLEADKEEGRADERDEQDERHWDERDTRHWDELDELYERDERDVARWDEHDERPWGRACLGRTQRTPPREEATLVRAQQGTSG